MFSSFDTPFSSGTGVRFQPHPSLLMDREREFIYIRYADRLTLTFDLLS